MTKANQIMERVIKSQETIIEAFAKNVNYMDAIKG
jgi:hypothetical protein